LPLANSIPLQLEGQPHDAVHVVLSGLMGGSGHCDQDPIFWLHHANIDRLWKRWLDEGGGRQDPLGDSALDEHDIEFFDETGRAAPLTGRQIIYTVGQLNYRYDDDPMAQLHPVPIERPTPLEATPVIVARRTLATSQTTTPGARIRLSRYRFPSFVGSCSHAIDDVC
jgi:hypothetical protein